MGATGLISDGVAVDYVANQKDLAAALQVSPAYVSKLKSGNRIAPEEDGRWCVQRVRQQIADSCDLGQSMAAATRAKARHAANGGGGMDAADGGDTASMGATGVLPFVPSVDSAEDGDLNFESYYGEDHDLNFKIARSFRERELAAQARITRMQSESMLVERAEVERAAFTEARVLRDTLMGLPTKIAPLLAPVSDPFELERMLRESLRQVLADCVRVVDPAGGAT